MSGEPTATATPKCINCGHEASARGEWGTVEHPTLGSMTQCPECGSTNVSSRR